MIIIMRSIRIVREPTIVIRSKLLLLLLLLFSSSWFDHNIDLMRFNLHFFFGLLRFVIILMVGSKMLATACLNAYWHCYGDNNNLKLNNIILLSLNGGFHRYHHLVSIHSDDYHGNSSNDAVIDDGYFLEKH